MDLRKSGRLLGFSLFVVLAVISTPAWAKKTAFFGTGENRRGQLGMGDTISRPTFTLIPGMSDAESIEAGSYNTAFGLKAGGVIYSVGAGTGGELGLGSGADRNTFTAVGSPTGVSACAAGDYHTAALKEGAIWSAGDNGNGALGLGDYDNRDVFTQATGLTNVTAISAGGNFTLARKSDGTLWGAGGNYFGQLGRGTAEQTYNTFGQAVNITGVTAVAGGSGHALALDSDGLVWAAGLNNMGQLAVADTTDRNVFTQVSGLASVATAIAAGETHSMALMADGTVRVAGGNGDGQLGYGSDFSSATAFVEAPGLTEIVAIAAAKSGSLAIKDDGTLWVAGDNTGGGLGLGSKLASVYSFTQVPGLTGVQAVTGGWGFAIVKAFYGAEVTYPSDADIVLERGGTYNIRWNRFNLLPKSAVKIELVKGGTTAITLCESTTKMPFKWIVGAAAKGAAPYADGEDFRIRVSLVDGSDSDESDNEFAIDHVVSLTIDGSESFVGGDAPEEYTCTANYGFGGKQDVTNLVKWSCTKVKGVKMGKTGTLTTVPVLSDTPCEITATYGKGKPPLTGSLPITIQAE